jgi:hypothetical protein
MRQAVACWIKTLGPISDRQNPRWFAAVCVCRNLNDPQRFSVAVARVRGPDDIAPALAAIAASVADGVISLDEAAAAANVLQKFLDVFEKAHRLGRGLSQVDEGSQ